MSEDIQVGIIGINAERGWAREAHAPAIQHTDGLALAAVATRRQASADAAAAALGVDTAYGDPAALMGDPRIDLVAVTAAVPAHRALILAALEAGKHVLTEWPVAVGTEVTREIAERAEGAGVRTAVGLQARANPAVLRARELLATGTLGRIRLARVTSTTAAFGPEIGPSDVALEDPATGMNLTTIQLAHTLDLVSLLAGPLEMISATRSVQFPRVRVLAPDDAPDSDATATRSMPRTLPDHVLVQGPLADEGAFSVEAIGGRPASGAPFRLELEAERGTIALVGGSARGFQAGTLDLLVDGQPVELGPDAGLPDSVVNVAGVYAALRDDIRHGTSTAPSFRDAVRLSELVDDVVLADATHRAVRPARGGGRQ